MGEDEQFTPSLINLCISAISDNYSIYQINKRTTDFISTILLDFQTLLTEFNTTLGLDHELNLLELESTTSNCFKIFDRYLGPFDQLDKKIDTYLIKIYLNDGQIPLNDAPDTPRFGPIFTRSGNIIKDPFNGSYFIRNDITNLNDECMSVISEYASLIDDLYNNLVVNFLVVFKSIQKIGTLLRPPLTTVNHALMIRYLDTEFEELNSIFNLGPNKIFAEIEELAAAINKAA
jgi:hypothetical protein